MKNTNERGPTAAEPASYYSYLLRLWCAEHSHPGCWRASLENPHTGERLGFASLEELFAFLMERVEAPGTELGPLK